MEKMNIKKSLLKKIARILIKLRISSLFKIKQKDFDLRFYPSSMSRILWVDQYLAEKPYGEEQEFFRRYLRPNDIVIDVGANIGFFTLIFSTIVGRTGKVYAIEPHPRIYKYLQGNLDLNSVENVFPFNLALGSKSGTVKFSDRKGDDRNAVITTGTGITVPQKRLDQLGIEDESIALLKIDVEGYEKFVIESAGQILKNVRCIYFEAIERHFSKFGYKLEELLNILVNYDFKILEISANKVYRLPSFHYLGFSNNLIAVRDINSFLKRTNFLFSAKVV